MEELGHFYFGLTEVLWEALRGRRLKGFKFRRQHPVDHYIVDFFCPAAKLVVEIDGPVHTESDHIEYDKIRDEFLRTRNYRVVRFSSDDVVTDLDHVLDHIAQLCQ